VNAPLFVALNRQEEEMDAQHEHLPDGVTDVPKRLDSRAVIDEVPRSV
jgi:hypothetical protein